MKVVCPVCNTGYRIPDEKLQGRNKAVATCKKCGARIEIIPGWESRPEQEGRPEPVNRLGTTAHSFSDSGDIRGFSDFEFITEHSEFFVYAGFWRRLAAFIVDVPVLMFLGFAAGLIMGFAFGFHGVSSGGHGPLGNVAGVVTGWLYFSLMESSSTQGTLGKMALGIKVTDTSGDPISFVRATARHFSKILSAVFLMIGYLMTGFTAKKQGLHDMIAGCLVVKK